MPQPSRDVSGSTADSGRLDKALKQAVPGDRHVQLLWRDGYSGVIPSIWLRDNCTCETCGDPQIGKRRLRIGDIPVDIAARSAEITPEGDLVVEWASDLHRSRYSVAWLLQHRPSEVGRSAAETRVLWDATLGRDLPQASASEVMSDSHARLRFFRQIRDYGLTLVRGLKPAVGELEEFAKIIGPLVETNFGRVFDIQFTREQHSIANSTHALMPHTDEPYRYNPPGVMFFHCLDASADGGGVSIFVDGFGVAEAFRQIDPDMFDLLTRVQVPYRRHYKGMIDVQAAAPIISTDARGAIEGIRFNDRAMAPLDPGDSDIENFYEAFRAICTLYYDQRRWCMAPLRSGDLMVFDNHRVLHGRTAFGADIQKRHIRQCHVDRADLHSAYRILARSFGEQDSEVRFPAGSFA